MGRIQVRSEPSHPPSLPNCRAPGQAASVRAESRPKTVFFLRPGSEARRGKQTSFVPGRGDLGLSRLCALGVSTPCSSQWKSWGELIRCNRKSWKENRSTKSFPGRRIGFF